ncbi:sigma-70 family RNA polymerase sigma factor [Catenuloplanes indicus]|uniref:RNA polymerase sigma-70 factor (ECF subfamily) n=1 Tax=Catenuloplanes indicus TaxID=137267 RepID=A0AAE4B098_9ACTN|nr:sigma-70 family RNA polymerase sigma factor [Catenuloplanes indicus]MDQ0370065.1 RNA polymerase sigma-70 factor (ECF subfamily) [Catenuloplanes indicus]
MDVREQAQVDAEADAWLRAVQAAHGPIVYRYLSGVTLGDRAAAEDMLQEVLLRAWRHYPTLSKTPDTVRAWMFAVARNLVIDAGRARRARPTEVSPPDLTQLPQPGDPMDRVLTAGVVREALRQLSPAHRAVLIEIYFGGAQASDVADRMGVPEGTVKSRAHYALRALREVLQQMET